MDLSGHFLIIGVGGVLSVLSFLGELCYNRCRQEPRSEWLDTKLNTTGLAGTSNSQLQCCLKYLNLYNYIFFIVKKNVQDIGDIEQENSIILQLNGLYPFLCV